ncbi:DMT family transporter [Acinetobacter sp. MD2(2019)]|uniref:DMT family transporter n=1 Tax=Acinetobacter sp. MD2(2019) TaxID=2605273 RepID=UPI002D1E9CDE|nr:DMT family transporter [Acinetobacter sp. MD2(2019)]MEB3753468.1 EamA family transporter [Acinetobacter sp. MD2(2019)]
MSFFSKYHLALTYALLVLIWSSTPLAIVWSVTDLNPYWALLFRFFLACPLAFLLLKILKLKFALHARALHSYVAGSFSLIGSQFFTYMATQYLSSGMIALMFGLSPIIAGLIGWVCFNQSLRFMQWLGMLVAVCGLGLICFSHQQQHIQIAGIFLMLISVFNYAMSIFWVKKVEAQLSPLVQATGSILVSTLISCCIIPFIWADVPQHVPSLRSILAIVYCVLMASLLAMFCYFKLVQQIQPTTLSLTNVMTPVFALLIGAALNHEQISLHVMLGALVLLSGLFIYFFKDLQLLQVWEKRFNATKQTKFK